MNKSIRDKWCEKEISDLDYIRHLEAENAKLKEPKTCDGCEYASYYLYDETTFNDSEECRSCYRSGWHDAYNPKEQQ